MFKTLKPIDLATLALVTVVASTGVPAWLGLNDRLSIAALTMGLACPAARRMIAWRRGAEPLRLGTDRTSTALVLAAMLPWIVIPGLRTMPWASLASLATAHIDLPMAVRVAGFLIAVAGVVQPMALAYTGAERIRSSAYIETAGLFLASGNLLLGILAAAWLLVSARTAQTLGGRTVEQPALA